ncbi:DUF3231 family protein [Bacillaceae bacterium S4-13-56]
MDNLHKLQLCKLCSSLFFTNCEEQVFSDKLMIFHVAALTVASTSPYGTSLGSSPRHDLGTIYVRLNAEILKFAEEEARIILIMVG